MLQFEKPLSSKQRTCLDSLGENVYASKVGFSGFRFLDPKHAFFLYPHQAPLSKSKIQFELVNHAKALISAIQSEFQNPVSVGISNPCFDSADLYAYVEQCHEALNGQMYDGSGQVFLYQYQRFSIIREDHYLNDFEDELLSGEKFNCPVLQEKLKIFFELLYIDRPNMNDLRNELFQFAVLIYTYCFRHNIPFYSVFGLKYPEPAMLDHFTSLDQVQDCFSTCLTTIQDLIGVSETCALKDIQRIVEYIQLNYASDISLQSVSDYMQISPNYICKVFKDETGINFKNYINLVRITQAKRLLRAGNGTISEIAEQVGFHNVSYFCRVFKENVGMTAMQFQSRP